MIISPPGSENVAHHSFRQLPKLWQTLIPNRFKQVCCWQTPVHTVWHEMETNQVSHRGHTPAHRHKKAPRKFPRPSGGPREAGRSPPPRGLRREGPPILKKNHHSDAYSRTHTMACFSTPQMVPVMSRTPFTSSIVLPLVSATRIPARNWGNTWGWRAIHSRKYYVRF